MSRQTISAVIIAHNEEANIRRCLESVRRGGVSDEIVVVDSGSTDGTLAICGECGCRVIGHEWEGYARQKNFAIGLATSDWILSLDADEEITPELAQEIEVVATAGNPVQAYSMPRRNLFLGKWLRHGGWYPDRQVRLFRRGAGEFSDVPLHEALVLNDPAGRIGSLASPLMHYTYPTVSEFVRRADLYTDIEAEGRSPRSRNGIPQKAGHPILALLTAFPLKFAETYVWKGGWLDGVHGFVASMLTATRVFMRCAKVWRRTREMGDRP